MSAVRRNGTRDILRKEIKMIKAENVTFSYSEDITLPVLDDVSITIEDGSFVAILGHNGSGKSTLAKHFNAILLPSGGKVYVFGEDTAEKNALLSVRKNVGMVFQNPDNQIVATVVEEDVAFGLENLGVPTEEMHERVKKALDAVQMSDFAKAAPHNLSGGQKQRVAIAGIIAMRPRCIALDEPTAMLDPSGRREIMKTIKTLNSEMGITVVLITHYMDEAAQADRVIVMDGGKVCMDDTPRNVFTRREELLKLGLDVPQVTELMHRLRGRGLDVKEEIISADECIEALLALLEEKHD